MLVQAKVDLHGVYKDKFYKSNAIDVKNNSITITNDYNEKHTYKLELFDIKIEVKLSKMEKFAAMLESKTYITKYAFKIK